MIALEAGLMARLKRRHVDVDVQDADTLVLRNVPTDERWFSKPSTNLLFVRPQEGLPFLVGVDADLQYSGNDRSLARAFTGSQTRQGWRMLNLSYPAQGDLRKVLECALRDLGFEHCDVKQARSPAGHQAKNGNLLETFGTDLTLQVREGSAEPSVARSEQVVHVVANILAWQARLSVIVGKPGVGKSNLLHAIAADLEPARPDLSLVSVNLGILLAGTLFESERENLIGSLLREAEAASGTVLALENVELAVLRNPCGAMLLSQALDHGLHLVGTSLPAYRRAFLSRALARRVDLIRLDELDPPATRDVLRALQEKILRHHGIGMGDAVLEAALERSLTLAGVLPAKAVTLLDAAAARAAQAGANEVEVCHVYLAGADFPEA